MTLLYIITYVKTYKTQAFYHFYGTLCNNVAKIIYIVLYFVLLIVVNLLKQNTNDTLNHLPEVPIREIWHYLTARREQYTKPERPQITA